MTRLTSLLFVLLLFVGACSDTTGEDRKDSGDTPNNTHIQDMGADLDDCPEGDPTCTADPCSVLSCRADQHCVSSIDGIASCECLAGEHEEDGACVEDVVCMLGTCNTHGTCTDGANGLSCACEAGYTGEFCGECHGWVRR